MTINSINKVASPASSLIESKIRGEIENINENHDIQFHTPENSKKTSPQLPPELINIVLKNAIYSCSSIEFIHLLTVCMKVNRDFYFFAKKILENPSMRAIWNKNKEFFYILEISVENGIVPEKERDSGLSIIESACSKISKYSSEQINFASKYIRKKTSSKMLGFIDEEFCEIKRILWRGEKKLKFREEMRQAIKISLQPSSFFPDQAHKALLDINLTPFTLPDIETHHLILSDIDLTPLTLPDIEIHPLNFIEVFFHYMKAILQAIQHTLLYP